MYHDCLLFLRAYPVDDALLARVDSELARIAAMLWRRRGKHAKAVTEAGLPFVSAATRFSHDCVRWLLTHPHCRVTFEAFSNATLDLNTVLRLTLPTLERGETNAEHSNDDLLEVLGVAPAQRLTLLISELSRLDGMPFVKDQLYDALGVTVRVTPTHKDFSTAFNRLQVPAPFVSPERIRHFDAPTLMNTPLPPTRELDASQGEQVVRVIRNAMTLRRRETDPATYLDDRSLRVFDLERGVSIAIYGMTHDRQLALESYIGFTAFRNGMPVAYGGAWVFGARADFGMNIFEPYRGGESGFLMCQLLRVYRQVFGVRYFEVDASQFGLDNPEGIDSGAFWFYYRYGFRPTDASLAQVARREKARLTVRPGARSTKRSLRALTASSVALNFGGRVPMSLYEVTTRVTRFVKRTHGADRPEVERASVQRFLSATGLSGPLDPDQSAALAELAMAAAALRVTDTARLQLLADMVRAKPVDVYRYQLQLTAFLAQGRARAPNR